MRTATGAVIAGGLGVALMYLFDPVQGGRRRAMARDQAGHFSRKARRFVNAATRDIGNRVGGVTARVRRARSHEVNQSDVRLEHVRAAIGRVVSHPGAVHVMIVDDDVRLDGAILARELSPLVAAIHSVNGIGRIDNRLLVRENGDGVPGLQGAGTTPRHSVRHTLRAPGVRAMALAGTAIALATAVQLRRRRRAQPPLETNLELPFGGA
jgi:hypothetical protein